MLQKTVFAVIVSLIPGAPVFADNHDGSDGSELTLEAVTQQAEDLGITVDDYINCPCGGAYAETEMQTPPWVGDRFELYAGLNTCVLRSIRKGAKTEAIAAYGSSGAKQVNCTAKVGLTTENNRIEERSWGDTEYSRTSMQACYDIIGAKARQWLSGGGQIVLVSDPKNDPKKRKRLDATMENLSCPVAVD